jgi:microcystin-dependent protein
MSEPFIGQIMLFGGNFAPKGWAFCDGSLLAIRTNTALFSILGTTYGGDGIQTFALPDLRGRAAIGAGNGPGLTPRALGETAGEENHTLISPEMPAHNHVVSVGASNNPPSAGRPIGAVPAAGQFYDAAANAAGSLGAVTCTNTGGNQAHNNMQPYLVLNYIIALQGVFPSRN